MKSKVLSLLLPLLLLCGCSTISKLEPTAAEIQATLDNILPPDFAGDLTFQHSNPYFHIGVKLGGVHKTADGKWTWVSLDYDRGDFWNTSGRVQLTPAVK